MTHTLLRTGSLESQKSELCWLVYQTKGVNDQNFVKTALSYIATIEAIGDDNWGDTKNGSIMQGSAENIKKNLTDSSRIRGVFSSREKAVTFLREVRRKELGMSVLISGVLSEIAAICKEEGIVPHSCNFSLGVFGRKDKLPDEKTLSIATMCGHHMIPAKYIKALEQDVDQGRMTAEEAAKKLASFCMCGVFNPKRACDILKNG